MERKKPVDLDSFVDGLKRFETDVITKDRVTEYCSELRIKDAALSPYLHFRPDRYTRNLIYQDRLFEVMVICWEPGQKTPVHSHNGQLGWMLVERGGIDVTNFRYLAFYLGSPRTHTSHKWTPKGCEESTQMSLKRT